MDVEVCSNRDCDGYDRGALQQCAACDRLEYLRGQIRAESISWGELAELQSLAPHIAAGDVELAEWAGVQE